MRKEREARFVLRCCLIVPPRYSRYFARYYLSENAVEFVVVARVVR